MVPVTDNSIICQSDIQLHLQHVCTLCRRIKRVKASRDPILPDERDHLLSRDLRHRGGARRAPHRRGGRFRGAALLAQLGHVLPVQQQWLVPGPDLAHAGLPGDLRLRMPPKSAKVAKLCHRKGKLP